MLVRQLSAAALGLSLVFGVTLSLGNEVAHAITVDSPPDYTFPRGLPHAPTEGSCYSYRCVWDAHHQGNGEGQSMLITRWHGGYVAVPISHRRAHALQAAYCARPSVGCIGYED